MEYLFQSPLGPLILGFSGKTLTSLRGGEGLETGLPIAAEGGEYVGRVCAWLSDYFAGKNPSPENIAYKASGSAFQERVWKILGGLPYGYCVTYGFLASLITPGGRGRLLARAVGNAVASNPIWIIIPCHRVIRANGDPGKYAGGAEMKKALLRIEGIIFSESCLKKN